MALDPLAAGMLTRAHVSLREAGNLRRDILAAPGFATALASTLKDTTSASPKSTSSRTAGASSARSFEPHTAIRSGGPSDPDRWDDLLNRLGAEYEVPPLFLKAVMLSESGGRPDAVGDSGHSVGLFQLHDQGYGYGMGDRRYDPGTNAERAVKGLAEAWHAGEKAGFAGEHAVRAAYNYSFNPGGGWAYQGDSVVRHYNQLLAEQGLPALR
jgi:soluble lytic murein transglycosylase-like protein